MSADSAGIDVVIGSSTRWPLAPPGVGWRMEFAAALRRMLETAASCDVFAIRYGSHVTTSSAKCAPQNATAEIAAAFEPAAIDWADVRGSLGGDEQAYARLVRRYQPRISAYMRRFTRDRRQWEELVQDVFVDAYLGLATYSGRAPLLHWLKHIGTRVGYRYWKGRQRRRREVALPRNDGDQMATASDGIESAQDAAEVVHHLLAQLTPRDRLVMTLIYLESHSLSEVAQLTNWSETMVKVQAHRARKRLAKICAQMGIEL